MRVRVTLILLVVVALLTLASVLLGHGSSAPSLADRINGACRPGYHVVDWTSGDEWHRIPAGTVQVTCEGREIADTYTVAVQRG